MTQFFIKTHAIELLVPSICGLWLKSGDLPGSWMPPVSHSNWRKLSHVVPIKHPLNGTFL